MPRKFATFDLLILSTAIGLIATIAAPWVELRGAFAAWRVVEWHTFWRGDNAFMLGDVVAANYRVPIEYATVALENNLRALALIGGALALWHSALFGAILFALRRALRARDLIAIILGSVIVLALLAFLLALPSSLDVKVDFRSASDVHTDTLIWSSIQILPIAPAFAVIAMAIQIIALWKIRNPQSEI
ncbi:MAG: hypothetical protein HZC40_17885 [Chloroflexi bacterium]|nr:hypothetical protein [Chloroflexota bacterium]